MIENLNTVIAKISKTGIYKRSDTPDFTALSVWDIDDTLYKTPTKVKIVHPDTGRLLASLSTSEYADFHSIGLDKIKEKYKTDKFMVDFSQFSDSNFFREKAQRTTHFQTAKKEFSNQSNFFIVLTARNNMIDPEIFLSKFESDGLRLKSQSNRSHLIRLASLGMGYKNKGSVLSEILKNNKNIKEVRYWDDSVTEVNSVNSIRSNFPSVEIKTTRIIVPHPQSS